LYKLERSAVQTGKHAWCLVKYSTMLCFKKHIRLA
jgi:hypothetical protein